MTIENLIEKYQNHITADEDRFIVGQFINDLKKFNVENEQMFLKFAEWFHGFDLIKVSDGLYMDKRCDKWNVRDLLASFRLSLISDKPKETYKKHAENDRHMLFNECPNCNWRCNCETHPCSCCDKDN